MIEQLFTSKHIRPQAYKQVLDQALGADWIKWQPETVWSEIERIFKVHPSGEVQTKINALKVFLTTSLFYTDAPVFENIVLAMNDLFVDPTSMQIASPEEIQYAMLVLDSLKPSNDHFGPEIVAYMQVSAKLYGILKYPSQMAFAQPTYTGELAEYEKHITPKYTDETKLDKKDVVAVQSMKMFQIETYVNMKLSKMDHTALEPSAA